MKTVPFDQERWQSEHENVVDYNLSESGVQALTLRDLLDGGIAAEDLLRMPLGYSQAEGTPELRSTIAATYGKLSAQHVLVCTGSSEANFAAAWHALEKGGELVFMMPNYLQIWGLAKSWGIKVKPLWLKEELGWQFDPEDLKAAITKKTKAIQMCNPNNPTGAVMGREQRKALLDAVKDSGAWLLSDEIYQGAEREGESRRPSGGITTRPSSRTA
ncbi:MAG: aminotransferase class I/II-fold pyridoxal phosphate-dependent enzyme [Thermoplasmata archaeon]